MNSKIAQTIYLGGTVVSGIIGITLIWGGIDAGTADSLNQIIGGIGVLLGGSGAAGTAAVRVNKQRKDGTFDTPPSPADQVIQALPTVVEQATQAVAELDRVKQAATDALGSTVTILGPLAKQAIDAIGGGR